MEKIGHGPIITPQRLQNDNVHFKTTSKSALLCNFTKNSDFTSDIRDIVSDYDCFMMPR